MRGSLFCGTKVPVTKFKSDWKHNEYLTLDRNGNLMRTDYNFKMAMKEIIEDNYCLFCRLRLFFYFFDGTDEFQE